MATADQYAEWIVKNQNKKGTPEFETVAEAYKVARSEETKPSMQAPALQTEVQPERSMLGKAADTGLGQGLIAGAAGIGKNLLTASTFIPRKLEQAANYVTGSGNMPMNQAVEAMQQGNEQFVKDNESKPAFGAGKLISEIAGTAGAGNVLAIGAKAASLPKLANALQSGGFSLGGSAGKTLAEKSINAATRIAGGAGAGAGSTALVAPENVGAGAAIGAAIPVVGKAAGVTGKAIGKSIAGKTSPEIVALANKAQKLGINIPADRLTNSKPLNAVASSLNYIPFSGRAATEEAFEKQLNKALSRTFGQNTDNVTMGLRKAADDLGHKFDNTLKSNIVKFDRQLLDDITNTQNQAATELSDQSLQIVNKQIDEIVKKGESGVIDGQAAYNIKRTLDRIGRGNNPEAYHARQLKKDLMNALDRSLGKDAAKEFAKVRQQYGTMIDLENIAQNGAEGGISIARLANMKNIKNPDLQDLADISAQFLKPREGQHGAMQRIALGTLGAAGSPIGMAGGAVAGRLANKALNSQAAKNLALGKSSTTKINPELLTAIRTLPISTIYD